MSCFWEKFQDEMQHQKTSAKKALDFFGSWSDILIFQITFTKSKS